MSWLDLIIVIVLIAAVIRGFEAGFARQVFAVAGFIVGLFLGAWLGGQLQGNASTQEAKSLLIFSATLVGGFLFLGVGEYIGNRVKQHFTLASIDKADRTFGALVSATALLIVVWLSAYVFASSPFPTVATQVQNSFIVRGLNNVLPEAPDAIAKLGKLVTPNGFPRVFTGSEPRPERINAIVPDIGELTPAVQKAVNSTVKIEGEGCGGIVDGSGFVAEDGLVITNAHVVAGVSKPMIIDKNGTHSATVIWFNPDMDVAILRTTNLAGGPLALVNQNAEAGSQAAVLGYPGGGDFQAKPAVVLEAFKATGRNIYDQGVVVREVYSLKADIISGDSGGPVVNKDGDVIGVTFAQSTTFSEIGYALTMQQVIDGLAQARNRTDAVATGACSL